MLNKVFAGLVIAFWAAMMTALLRVDVFPRPPSLETVSTDRIMRKVFSNPHPVRLTVYYNKYHIGFCQIDIEPSPTSDFSNERISEQASDGYVVNSKLSVWLSAFGMPSRLLLKGTSTFDRNRELKDFEFVTTIGGGHPGDGFPGDGQIELIGDDRTKKVQVMFDFGDFHDKRSFDFDQIKGAGFANAFGLPGMAGFGLLGPSRLPGSSEGEAGPVTTTYIDRIEIAGNPQRVFLIHSKIDDQLWIKMWVDDSGEVLQVVTSLGLEMKSAAFGMPDDSGRLVRHGHRWEWR
ncbi:MAG TPA: hypothetical protein VLZ30_06170 [Verrucomicrobiae bacterium]|nr:hypothetical protein [Verrucomicrobiae bacterium]